MEQFKVTGMSCAACVAHVEKAVQGVAGVQEVTVSLLTNSMNVTYAAPANAQTICAAVKKAGYGAFPMSGKTEQPESELTDEQTPKLLRRLITSLVFWLILMYISMGTMMFDLPLPGWMSGMENAVTFALVQMVLTEIILLINYKFFTNGFSGLIRRTPGMDALVAVGSTASFLYSLYATFRMSYALGAGDMEVLMHYHHDLYYEGAATIVTLITLGKVLESHSKGKTTNALKGLMNLAPKTATLLRDDGSGKTVEVTVSIDEVSVGDRFVVQPGQSIPVDGVVLEGVSAVNESALTGESLPVDKEPGSQVSAATINQSGHLICEATKVGQDTTLNQIIEMVKNAAASKAPIAKLADTVAGFFVPVVMAIALVTLIVWLLVGQSFNFSLTRAISVLVISCPCALGLATPVAIMVGSGKGAKGGILFKTATSLENTGKTQIVVLDKTGTITVGHPEVTDRIPARGVTLEELMQAAFALESKSEHPLSKAILNAAPDGAQITDVADFKALPGFGVQGTLDGADAVGGNAALMEKHGVSTAALEDQAQKLALEGKTPLYFAKGGKLLGLVAVADQEKPDSKQAISELKRMGMHVVMLTGDNPGTANAVARRVGVDEVIAGVLPGQKQSVVQRLQRQGKVAMVGDGINDAPALTAAEIGIAVGAGTDVAIDAADVVLMKNNLLDVAAAIRLSRSVIRNIKQNLFWAFIYNVIGIPLAAGCWYALWGVLLNPMFAAAAMSLSSFCVVTNALRLNLCKIHDSRHDKPLKSHKNKKVKGVTHMTKTMKIEGMMCGHCQARVQKALLAVPGVENAEVSHETGSAVVTANAAVTDEMLRAAVEAQDYKVVGIE